MRRLFIIGLLCYSPVASAQWTAATPRITLPLAGAKGGLGIPQPTCTSGQHLTCNGATCSCSADTGGADLSGVHYVTTQAEGALSAETVVPTCSGTDKLTFSGGTLSCATDHDTIYALPAATAGALGGVRGPGGALICTGSQKVTGMDASGILQCAADTTYTLPAATLSTLGGIKGPVCSAGNHVTGFDGAGALTCATDPATSGSSVLLGNGSGGFANYGGSTCSAGQAPLGLTAAGAVSGCFTPAGTYTLPQATNATLGGVIAPSCSVGNHWSSILAGTLQCSADAGGGGGAPTASKYILQQADGALPNAQALGALSTGLVKSTTTTGVLSIGTAGIDFVGPTSGSAIQKANGSGGLTAASSGTDYGPPTSGNTTGLVISTITTGAHTAYGGTSCTNQFPRSLSTVGAATCASVDLSADTAATVLPIAKGGTANGSLSVTAGNLLVTDGSKAATLADAAVGSALVSGGVGAAPAYSATGTCTSSAATTCTIAGRRSGCLPVCSMTTSVSTTFRAAISTTTITCTFGTSGTNTCNCVCF